MTAITANVVKSSILRRIFDNRLVRFVTLFLITLGAYAGAQVLPIVALPHIPAESRETFAIAMSAVSAVALLAVYWIFVRLMEHRKIGELSLHRAPGGAIAGAMIGFGLFAAVIAVLAAMGIAHVDGYAPGQTLLRATNMAVLSAIGEELVFRGVVFRIFEEMFGTLVALLVSAGFFGLIHMGNHGATVVSGIAIALEAGLLLAVSYLVVRNLWLPIGLHFGWNFTESAIFGSVVSGTAFKGLFHTTLTGPDLLTGGKFGPEASVVAIGLCAGAALVIAVIAVRRGEWRPLRLRIKDKPLLA